MGEDDESFAEAWDRITTPENMAGTHRTFHELWLKPDEECPTCRRMEKDMTKPENWGNVYD